MKFANRTEAGKQLALKLIEFKDNPNVVVLGLPRGGVPIAYEIARALHAPMDVFLVRKLGVPSNREIAMGAIASGGVRILNTETVRYLNIPAAAIDQITAEEQQELARRELLYRGDRPLPDLRDKIVILVDDGLATGATMKAAVESLRKQHPAKIVVTAPVAAYSTCQSFESLADDIICICDRKPEPFYAVGLWYSDFRPTTDEDVNHYLRLGFQRDAQCAS